MALGKGRGVAIVGGLAVLGGAAGLLLAAPMLRSGSAPSIARVPPRAVATPAPRVHAAAAPVAVPASAPAPASEPYRIRHVLPIDHAMAFGEWHWDEAGAPKTGELVVTVDIKAQVLSVFRDGWEIGTAVVLYGAGPTPTPLGVFRITQKDADHHSNIYDGAPMPYMMRLTNDGVSIHGDLVADGWATHGCVGVPTPFAKKLFGTAKLGDRVIVTNGETLGVGQAIKAA